MGQKEIRGVMALMTKYHPCDENGAIDEESFRNHLNWLIRKGVHAVGVNCGADFDYNDAERKRITEILVEEVSGRIPCYMGASAWDTETCIKRAKDVEERGADGVFMTGPPLDQPLSDDPQKGIVEHFRRISDAVNIPISFYNTPGTWPGIMPPETLIKIAEAAPRVKYVKAGTREMSDYKIMADGLADNRLKIIAGKSYCNFHHLHYSWNKPNRPVGLCGYLPAIIPAEHVALWEAFESNDIDKAREIWNSKILPIADFFYGRAFGYNEKFHPLEMLQQMGIIKNARIPFSIARVDEYTRKEIAKYIEKVKPDIS
jgi:4-hydroxy-tetrahydrodipicolinate synthase